MSKPRITGQIPHVVVIDDFRRLYGITGFSVLYQSCRKMFYLSKEINYAKN